MAAPSAGDLRNFAIVGHASSGKTTLSEAMLACAGVIGRMGNIAQGSTVSDYHVSEKQHQISTQTSLLHCTSAHALESNLLVQLSIVSGLRCMNSTVQSF